MRVLHRIYRCLFVVAIVAIWGFMLPVQTAYAGCVPGLPCETAPSASQLLDPSTGPNADKSDGDASCDANFMNQIYAKGFLEAEREVIISNSLIMKPDSVLEYSCFDQMAALTAENSNFSPSARPLFGETDEFTNVSVNIISGTVNYTTDMGASYLDDRLNDLVFSSLNAYVNTNFSHDFLGGAASGDNNNIGANVGAVASVCDFMYNLHYVSQCDDFALNTGFMGFEAAFGTPALESTDPRVLPPGMTCSAHGITTSMIQVAKNETWNYASFDPVDTNIMNFPITNEPSGGACENSDPIPTGVMVSYEERDIDLTGDSVLVDSYTYEEKVCSNPACYFDNGGNASPGDDECVP